ncbi:hypothetical protein VSH64_43630 [Amycolatopsis rhabdoformis]|uniref:Uncharacterized protein n=1 Tax=Amycolatopsis rhabdoformis TaxID=1448059 RepID=A0ABZ1I6M7_9PSEU|nr:hypothetical protein [Amycolatopsis rhabdoformis]WSE29616.1 hypothetical protein VSH64_43630 [Amycolatopsis rhabdoformis]
MPFSFVLESVSIRKTEIDTAVNVAGELSTLLGRGESAGADRG